MLKRAYESMQLSTGGVGGKRNGRMRYCAVARAFIGQALDRMVASEVKNLELKSFWHGTRKTGLERFYYR